MKWFAAQSPTEPGLWCCARASIFGPTVEMDGFNSKQDAANYARDLTQKHERDQARRAREPDRLRIPVGFYTDKDAA